MKIRSIFDFKRYIYNILKLVGRTPWQSRGYDSAFTAEGPGSIPGQGTKILQATLCDQKKKRERKNLWDIATTVYRGQLIALFTLTRKVETQ